MDFITAGGILFCVAMLWAFTGLVLWQLIKLQRKVEQLEYGDLEELFERVVDLEITQELKAKEQNCQDCHSRKDCPAAFLGVLYPCKYYEKEV